MMIVKCAHSKERYVDEDKYNKLKYIFFIVITSVYLFLFQMQSRNYPPTFNNFIKIVGPQNRWYIV